MSSSEPRLSVKFTKGQQGLIRFNTIDGGEASVDMLEDRGTIHKDLYKLEKWTDRNLTEFKGKVLHLG